MASGARAALLARPGECRQERDLDRDRHCDANRRPAADRLGVPAVPAVLLVLRASIIIFIIIFFFFFFFSLIVLASPAFFTTI